MVITTVSGACGSSKDLRPASPIFLHAASVPHAPSNFRDIAYLVAELNAVLCI